MSNTIYIQLPDGTSTTLVQQPATVISVIEDAAASVTVSSAVIQNKATPSGNGTKYDAHYSKTFIVGDWSIGTPNELEVVHNLGKFPSVQVFDTNKNLYYMEVKHIDNNNAIIYSNATFSGFVYCN
jgi:hypothetical protein